MRHALLALGLALVAAATASACVEAPRMCTAATECGKGAGCVAGRCLPNGGIPAIQNARRLVIDPVDVAYVRPGEGPSGGALPELFTLGRAKDAGALLFLRFSVPLAKDANVLEAYLLLERADVVDVDPAPIALHAARVVDPWEGPSTSWARQPRVEETRSPSTQVIPTARAQVRVDVRELVLRWRAHDPSDQGLALVAESSSPTGVAFALAPLPDGSDAVPLPAPTATSPLAAPPAADARGSFARSGPRLELYVK